MLSRLLSLSPHPFDISKKAFRALWLRLEARLLSHLLKMATYASAQASLYQLSMIYYIMLLFLFFSSIVIAHPYTTHNSHSHRFAVAGDVSVCRREAL
jgi:hypothetical protein